MTEIDNIHHRFDAHRLLMPNRIRKILLVSSLYDAYILEEDGSLEEHIWRQYTERGLSTVPQICKVSSIEKAEQSIKTEKIDLVLTIVHEDRDLAFELSDRVKGIDSELPVVVLATDPKSLDDLALECKKHFIDRVFLWQNDAALLLAIIKYVEDRANAAHDTEAASVRIVVLVEDSVAYYSSFLPTIYTAIMGLTRRLIDDGYNHLHRQLRMRSRAKILLVDNYEEAIDIFNRYRPYILGVVTDIRFWKEGLLDDDAGITFTEELRRQLPELPICIQSAEPEKNRSIANELKTFFINKNSDRLNEYLYIFLQEYLGFGDFVFKLPDGQEMIRIESPHEMLKALRVAPIESILYHAKHQDFSHWMMARTEIKIAEQFYPRTIDEFDNNEDMREFLIGVIQSVLYEKQSDIITRFCPDRDPHELQFMRLGEGSIGGKARGIGFLRYLLSRLEIRSEFPQLSIQIPPTLVVCSGEFENFCDSNGLYEAAHKGSEEFSILQQRFLDGKIRPEIIDYLRAYLEKVTEPLAVRSSSIMEDSQHLPLAGLYSTFMLSNNDPSLEARLNALLVAVKLVWASTYGDDPRAYFRQSAYRIEDESMAVVIQTLGGSRRQDTYYPTFSGVGQSYNFYPVSYMKPEDGVAQVALGLGKTVVEGGPIVRFCPRYPQLLPQFADIRDWLYFTQKHFYALDMNMGHDSEQPIDVEKLAHLPLSIAEEQGVLQQVASVYQGESNLLVDSLFYEGPRVITFEKILRDPNLRLGKFLSQLLSLCETAMRAPVEIEFAVDLAVDEDPVFYPLQLRPMAAKKRWEKIEIKPDEISQALCHSTMSHGNGIYRDIRDIVVVKPESFSTGVTSKIATEIGEINKRLVDEQRPFLLVGFGRWGSTDPEMGIGVKWSQISGVRVLVEVGKKGFNVDPAQGTHFFQNVTSLNIGCLSVPYDSASFFRWELLKGLNVSGESTYLKHFSLAEELDIRVDGRSGHALISLV